MRFLLAVFSLSLALLTGCANLPEQSADGGLSPITKGSVNVPGVAVPASGQTLTVEAQVKDVAGNLGDKGADSAKVDTGIPNDGVAPTVEITTDANNDGFIIPRETFANVIG